MTSINKKMKAVILAAGLGTRLMPLTNKCPKSLLEVGNKTILEMAISNILDCGINEIIIVTGYFEKQIKDKVKKNFPSENIHFVTNKRYAETNAGFSLMLVKKFVQDVSFIKFDADVVFEKEILQRLIKSKYKNCLCLDKEIALGHEEIKVTMNSKNRVHKINKKVDPKIAIGESIGIEKIDKNAGSLLFQELELMMKDKRNHQAYYETAYENLIVKGTPFFTLDITGLKWVEVDTEEDLSVARKLQL